MPQPNNFTFWQIFEGRTGLLYTVQPSSRYNSSVLNHFAMALFRSRATHVQIFSRILSQSIQGRRSLASDNISLIQKEFTKQAAVFENRWNHRMKRDNKEIMGWVLEQVGQVSNETRALDVASGTGIFARALAPFCRFLYFQKFPKS